MTVEKESIKDMLNYSGWTRNSSGAFSCNDLTITYDVICSINVLFSILCFTV